jgi:pyrroline-5-carboxylate reductase
MTVLIIGGGNMGSTFAESFLSAHIIRPNQLLILEVNEARVAYLKEKDRGIIKTEVGDYISEVDLIVLAVKPQTINQIYPNIRPFLKPHQLVLSIMAGVRLQSLEDGLGIKKIIRAMPNLPAQVGMGMTAFTAQDDVNKHELIAVQNLLSTTGRAIYFDKEEMIDAATAISGSGPAYVFYFMNAMVQAAIKLGFSSSEAEFLVGQTFTGAVQLQNRSKESHQQWIDKVSSKGGTTEAAIKIFNKFDTENTINEAIFAANNRAEELGK